MIKYRKKEIFVTRFRKLFPKLLLNPKKKTMVFDMCSAYSIIKIHIYVE